MPFSSSSFFFLLLGFIFSRGGISYRFAGRYPFRLLLSGVSCFTARHHSGIRLKITGAITSSSSPSRSVGAVYSGSAAAGCWTPAQLPPVRQLQGAGHRRGFLRFSSCRGAGHRRGFSGSAAAGALAPARLRFSSCRGAGHRRGFLRFSSCRGAGHRRDFLRFISCRGAGHRRDFHRFISCRGAGHLRGFHRFISCRGAGHRRGFLRFGSAGRWPPARLFRICNGSAVSRAVINVSNVRVISRHSVHPVHLINGSSTCNLTCSSPSETCKSL
ncbi:hypothetical protein BANRA_05781 [Klebsiella pneumoniae]|nr:hypothetical protein BANRA_05781 [Klebsiella pneumoniae]